VSDEIREIADDEAAAIFGRASAEPEESDEPLESEGLVAARAHLAKHTYRATDLDGLPLPCWQIRDFLLDGSLTYLAGAPNHGKSFVAISVACSVATGHTWFGRPVKPGKVLYIAAEGGVGVRKRLRVWERENGVVVENMTVVTVPVQIDSTHWLWRALEELVRDGQFDLIVLDTQARMTVGKDENSQQDMSPVIELLEDLRRIDGEPTVLVVHHSAKAATGPSLRGSGALTAACESIIGVKRTYQRKKGAPPGSTPTKIEVTCERQKDSEAFEDLYFDLVNIDMGDYDSAVLRPGAPFKKPSTTSVAVTTNSASAKKTAGRLVALPGGAEVVVDISREPAGFVHARNWLEKLGDGWVTPFKIREATGKDSVQAVLKALRRYNLDAEIQGSGSQVKYRLTEETIEALMAYGDDDEEGDDDE
jgi:hypothetical protein